MGACFDCVVTVDGRIGQRACMTRVADGMIVTGDAIPPLAALGAEPTGVQADERACDVLVVGAGPAGLAAAIAAAETGAGVVVLDERSATGGQYAKPLADSYADVAPDAQFRLGTELRERAMSAGARIRPRQQSGRLRCGRDCGTGGRACGGLPARKSGAGAWRTRAAGAVARVDFARRHDHGIVADARAGAAGVSG